MSAAPCSLSSCPRPAVVAVTFTTGYTHLYCARHNAGLRTEDRPGWDPDQVDTIERLEQRPRDR